MSEFFAMGGYAIYVWASYALSVAVLGGLAWSSWRRAKALEAELAQFESEDGA